jgi:hypothetical protein
MPNLPSGFAQPFLRFRFFHQTAVCLHTAGTRLGGCLFGPSTVILILFESLSIVLGVVTGHEADNEIVPRKLGMASMDDLIVHGERKNSAKMAIH